MTALCVRIAESVGSRREFMYTPPTRRDSTVSSRRRCVLGFRNSHNSSICNLSYLDFYMLTIHTQQSYLCSPVNEPSRNAASNIVIIAHECYNKKITAFKAFRPAIYNENVKQILKIILSMLETMAVHYRTESNKTFITFINVYTFIHHKLQYRHKNSE